MPLSEFPSAYLLHSALSRRKPPIDVSMTAVRTWWDKYRHGQVQASVSNAKDLDDKYGEIVRRLATEHRSAYKLTAALKKMDTPLHVSDGIARQWLIKHFGPLHNIESARAFGDLVWRQNSKRRSQGSGQYSSFRMAHERVPGCCAK